MSGIYAPFILNNLSRVLTQIDRDPHSQTYGCCDRNFWHLKIRDFSSAILQQAGLSAMLLYQVSFEGNPCYNNDNVKEWAKATLYYWAQIQLSDGSFNEYYPNEHGFPPTAFSLFSACSLYKRLGLNDSFLKQKIKKTADFLANNIETQALNQETASILAVYCASEILNDKKLLGGCKNKLSRLLKVQSKEGWFAEYGGADLGYLSVTLDMMAEYYCWSKDQSVIEPINKMIDFIQYFVHPDGTVGGEYGSRNTTYFLPNGLEVAAGWGNKIASDLKRLLFFKSNTSLYFMDSTDDRYFSHYLLHSFLRAIEREGDIQQPPTASVSSADYKLSTKYFSESRLLSYSNDVYSAFVGLGKGGVIKVFCNGKETYINCGYRVPIEKGKSATTNWQDASYQVKYDEGMAKVSGTMNRVSLKTPSPILHLGLRISATLFGKSIIGFLKKILIFKTKNTDIKFSREIKLEENRIILKDTIESAKPITLERANNMSLRHVASGKFFMMSDLLAKSGVVAKDVMGVAIRINIDVGDCTVEEYIEVYE